MKVPKSECHWDNTDSDGLGDCAFEVFFTKIDDIQIECNGSPRKQTKLETLMEGLNSMHNAQAASNLVGSKFIVSRSGRPLHVTKLPADVLRKFKLPQAYEDTLAPDAPDASNQDSGFNSFANSSFDSSQKQTGNAADSKRISLAAKCMFLALASSLEVIYTDDSGDLFVCEVKAQPNPLSLVEAVFDSGEHWNNEAKYYISFGLCKKVEA